MEQSRGARGPRSPHPRLVLLILLLGVVAIVVTGLSLRSGGIGWDSRYETNAALASRAVNSDDTLASAYEKVPTNSEFQGVFLYRTADWLHSIRGGTTTGGSSEYLIPDDSTTYQYQGLVNIVLALIAVTALAVAIGVALRSVLAGAFAWSLTLSTPLWLGMSHVDFKDVPVAAGLTMISAGLILSLALKDRSKAITAGVLLAGAGGALTLSSRAGAMVLILALAGGTALAAFALAGKERRLAGSKPVLLSAASAVIFGVFFTWLTNPIARISLFTWLWDAFQENRSFPFDGTIRTAGVDVSSMDIPLWYVPAWLVAQLPLLTLVGLVAATAWLSVTLNRRRELFRSRAFISLTPIVIQGLILPAFVVLGGAVLYDGIRHLLFMIPALMAVPAIGVALIERQPPEWIRSAVAIPAACAAVVAFSLFASIRWAPYSYAFVNPVAGLDKDAWEIDYWGVSGREGVTRLRDMGLDQVRIRPNVDNGIPFGGAVTNGPLGSDQETGLYEFIRGPERAADLGCEVVFEIKRDGQLLGEGARCPPGS